jgi:hypothetical protein
MGRILPASKTGCSAKNQRKLGRAIRRARALGFMPIWSRHPALSAEAMLLSNLAGSSYVGERLSMQTKDSRDFFDKVMNEHT